MTRGSGGTLCLDAPIAGFSTERTRFSPGGLTGIRCPDSCAFLERLRPVGVQNRFRCRDRRTPGLPDLKAQMIVDAGAESRPLAATASILAGRFHPSELFTCKQQSTLALPFEPALTVEHESRQELDCPGSNRVP